MLPVSPSGGTGSTVGVPDLRHARAALWALFLMAGCHSAPQARLEEEALAAEATPTTTRIVDSILPLEEEIRRFTNTSPPLLHLSNGAPSREELVEQWVAAIETRDSAALGRLHVTPGEFIGLYYPNSVYTSPPYRQSPSLVWFRMVNSSSRGSTRVMQRHGGHPFPLRGLRCEEAPMPRGPIRVWSPCLVQREGDSTAPDQRLFGPILEHEGRFKFLTYDSEY